MERDIKLKRERERERERERVRGCWVAERSCVRILDGTKNIKLVIAMQGGFVKYKSILRHDLEH